MAGGLAAARRRGRDVAVGEIFRGRAGGAAGAVHAARPRRAQGLGDARPLYRGRGRARRDGAASRLAGAERFPALRLCRAPRRAVARADRPHLASAAVRGRASAFFLLPSLADRGAAVLCRAGVQRAAGSRRPTPSTAASSRWLAFGPIATVLAMSAVSGRGTVAMWGYPLWLFLGLWLVLTARRALDEHAARAHRCSSGRSCSPCLALAFIANYDVLPRYDHRYRAVFFPGGELGARIVAALSRRHRQAARLCDRHHVGRRQCRALRARAIRAC